MALPRKNRIRKAPDFQRLLKGGKRIRGVFLSIYFDTSQTIEVRVGVTIPTRVVPKAVSRNRIKRVILEIARKEKEHNHRQLDLLISLKKVASEKDLKEELRSLFSKLPR